MRNRFGFKKTRDYNPDGIYYDPKLMDLITSAVANELTRQGFAIVPGVVDDSLRREVVRDIEASVLPSTAGVREDSPYGWGLAPFVGREWEQAFARVLPSSMRQVILRTSFVLGKNGGALRQLSRVVRYWVSLKRQYAEGVR